MLSLSPPSVVPFVLRAASSRPPVGGGAGRATRADGGCILAKEGSGVAPGSQRTGLATGPTPAAAQGSCSFPK